MRQLWDIKDMKEMQSVDCFAEILRSSYKVILGEKTVTWTSIRWHLEIIIKFDRHNITALKRKHLLEVHYYYLRMKWFYHLECALKSSRKKICFNKCLWEYQGNDFVTDMSMPEERVRGYTNMIMVIFSCSFVGNYYLAFDLFQFPVS
jgi:hypothetical protein